MKYFLSLLLTGYTSLFFTQTIFAQEEKEPTPKPASGNASQIYVEFLGPGGYYSVNYDGRFGRRDKGLGGRIGFSAIYADGDGVFTMPIGLNYLAGSNGNYFEVGAGITLASDSQIFEDDGNTGTWGHLTLGYRRQAYRRKGVTWRIAFTPLFGDGFFIPFIGASLGYRF